MRLTIKGLATSLAVLAVFFVAQVSYAATVTFSDITATDGDDAVGFDVSATAVSGGDPNTLDLGVDPFSISAATTAIMSDTLRVTVTAPVGYVITGLSYSEAGSWDATSGFAAATVQLLANGDGPSPGGVAGFATTGAWGPIGQDVDLGAGVSEVMVSINNDLFAAGGASISKSAGSLTATVSAIPLPPAVWMMGAAIAALVSVGRRQSA